MTKKKTTRKTTTNKPAAASQGSTNRRAAQDTKPTKQPATKRLSALTAAAKVLSESTEPLNTKQMVEAMTINGYWTSPGGKTPHATLHSAIMREINTKGAEARFKKIERGKFTTNG